MKDDFAAGAALVAALFGAFMLGLAAGASTVENTVTNDCAKVGATRIDEKVITCAVKP